MVFAFWAQACWSVSYFPDKYDGEFKDVVVLLPPGIDWRLLKAQCFQESRLNPLAVSPVGAKGLCQFMPGTWKEVKGSIGVVDVWNPEESIRAAAWYMNRLNRSWSSPRPIMDRWMLSQASYNAGMGNLLRAQKLCHGKSNYVEIIQCLPMVTGHHSEETIGYVNNIIGRWWPAMKME